MATKEEVFDGLVRVKEKFKDPTLKDKFSDFTKKIQFSFKDLNTNYVMDVVNGEVKALKEENIEKPDISVTMNSDIFIGILNKKVNAITSYMTGKIKVKGAMGDLIKMQKILM